MATTDLPEASGNPPWPDREAQLARGDFGGLTKADLPTPCLVVDQAMLAGNLARMASHSRATGLRLRPHFKVHRCVAIARRQMELGAMGVCTATVAEAELLSQAGIHGVLWTSQPAGANKVRRAVALARQDPTFMFAVDSPEVVDQVEAAAAAAHTVVGLVVDVYAGLTRQGIQAGPPALALAQRVHAAHWLRLRGLMGYAGWASHTHGWEARRERSRRELAGLAETVALCQRAGLPVDLVSGGCTGTYDIDTDSVLTELQCGSYVFMDTEYRAIGSQHQADEFADFGLALTVMATVTGRPQPGQCTIDAGDKAVLRPTDRVRDLPRVTIENQGAEYGILHWSPEDEPLQIGQRVEIYPTILDQTTNASERFYIADGDRIVDAWPIMGRSGPAQR
jgi:D-serine deaminase-like pyridoxal phosphate-dependent protein